MKRVSVIPNGGEMGLAQTAATAANKGEIPWVQAERLVAHKIADDLSEHRPFPFPPCPQIVADYITRRVSGMLQRDGQLAIKNGEWLDRLYNARSLNMREGELLLWAIEKCLEAKSEPAAKRIAAHYMRHFYTLNETYPHQLWRDGCAVQRMDSQERNRGASE